MGIYNNDNKITPSHNIWDHRIVLLVNNRRSNIYCVYKQRHNNKMKQLFML